MQGKNRGIRAIFDGVDMVAVLLYLLLVAAGCICIVAASYSDETADIFSMSNFYMKQIVWVSVALVAGLVVLLLDVRYYHMFAYPAYIAGLFFLIIPLFLPAETNGAKAWIALGSFKIQPIEFAKIATALAVARAMSAYSFSITRFGNLLKIAIIIGLPLLIVIMQNDTGSGIVLGSFLFVFYREGLNNWLCIPVLAVAALLIVSLLLTPLTMLVILILLCVGCDAMMNGGWMRHLKYLAALAFFSMLLYLLVRLLTPWELSMYASLLTVVCVSLAVVAAYAYRAALTNTYIMLMLFVGAMIFLPTTNALFNSLKEHQQDRIKTFLGIKDDPQDKGYNVNQSKIAIGSGGLTGKGFLEGTQVKYSFVPEKHTDFIFCTVGEEHGFVGCVAMLTLFCALILRLMRMGDRQLEAFGRIYCYSVAAILLFHVLVNIGMTIGLMPVMGIPLPLISYGGSSLIAFTILIFIAIRLDAATRQDA